MPERQGILDTIFDSLAPVHPDGHKFIAIGAALTLLFFLLYPPVGWLLALENAGRVVAGLTVGFRLVRAIAHQPAGGDKVAIGKAGRQCVAFG